MTIDVLGKGKRRQTAMVDGLYVLVRRTVVLKIRTRARGFETGRRDAGGKYHQ